MDYDPTQFRGAARYYLRGRAPYFAELGAVLADELHLDGTGRLLDVGCGPGTVGVQLAALFEHVTLVEPDPDMLAAVEDHLANSSTRCVTCSSGRRRTVGRGTGQAIRACESLDVDK